MFARQEGAGPEREVGEYAGHVRLGYEGDTSLYMTSTGVWSLVDGVEREWVIDAEFVGNETRFNNHSAEPNCAFFLSKENHEVRVYVYVTRWIEPHGELLADYGVEYAKACGLE